MARKMIDHVSVHENRKLLNEHYVITRYGNFNAPKFCKATLFRIAFRKCFFFLAQDSFATYRVSLFFVKYIFWGTGIKKWELHKEVTMLDFQENGCEYR